jgi:hypothetical protein
MKEVVVGLILGLALINGFGLSTTTAIIVAFIIALVYYIVQRIT